MVTSLASKEVFVRQQLVSAQLAVVLAGDLREAAIRRLARLVERDDAHGFVGASVQEGRGKLAIVVELQRALAEPTAGDGVDGVGGAAINLNEDEKRFAIFAARLGDADATAAEQ